MNKPRNLLTYVEMERGEEVGKGLEEYCRENREEMFNIATWERDYSIEIGKVEYTSFG